MYCSILKSVNLRGDADSLSAVVGQIAGAYYGIDSIPKEWREVLNQWDHNEIALRELKKGRIDMTLNLVTDSLEFLSYLDKK